MNYSNHPVTKEYRQLLRKNETPSERLLWKKLQRKQLEGYRFRQQHGFGPYILDFYCPRLRLCIELDGGVHDDPIQKKKDEDRTCFLNANRIHVLRFRNEEVENDIEKVLEQIRNYMKGLCSDPQPPNLGGLKVGVILAAGMARRLRPLTDTKPKCLLEVGGQALLQRTVDAMMAAGCSEFVVVTGYKEEMIRNFLAQHYPLAVFTFIDNADYEHNNNIFSLWLSMQAVHGREVLLMDSDILCDPETVGRIARMEGSALAVNRHELGEEEMKVVVDDDMRITEISKTCRPEDALGESVGIEKMTADYTEALYRELQLMIEQEGLIDIFYERAFERLIPQGHTFKVVDTTDLFSYELDTPEDYERAKELFELGVKS
ncbi:MAG: DUF559 domain-containing protein [Prevotella sp.]|nr:DUF559 domain-containing protein [Prevotella sp.]